MNSKLKRGLLASVISLGLIALVLVIFVVMSGPIIHKKSDKARMDMKALAFGLDEYKKLNGYYPSTQQGLKLLVSPPQGETQVIKRLIDDPWHNPYRYTYPGIKNKNSYDLYSYGADNKAGGTDENQDLSNWE